MEAQINLSSTTSFELREALLVYRTDRASSRTGSDAFVTKHNVKFSPAGVPSLETGSPLHPSDIFTLVEQLRGALPVEFLRAHVLVRTQEAIVWWAPSAIRPMFYTKEKGREVAGLSGKRYPQPGLIFRLQGNSLDVRAVACHDRPEPHTPLYRAPYWNVNDRGDVCLGTARTPKNVTVESLPLWEKAFFESEFTHPNAAHKLTEHPGGFVGLWKSLAGKRRFPAEYLADAKETLGQLIQR